MMQELTVDEIGMVNGGGDDAVGDFIRDVARDVVVAAAVRTLATPVVAVAAILWLGSASPAH